MWSTLILVLSVFVAELPPAELSISLGECSLSCNEEGALPNQHSVLAGPPGKAGPTGLKGDRGYPGPRGDIGSPGEACDCSKYDGAFSKLQRLVENRFNDCSDAKRLVPTSGISIIFPFPGETMGIHAYCDQKTDGGGWIVIQRRVGGTENFFRGWDDYVTGFGSKETDFWIGLEIIHKLTSNGTWELRVDLVDFDESEAYAKYRVFKVAESADNYRLSVSGYSGTAGDSLLIHNGMQFTTKGSDNDIQPSGNCAEHHIGAWWYAKCHTANLNGLYNATEESADGVTWFKWNDRHISLKRAEMKIRRVE